MSRLILAAPLQGYTDSVWRRAHSEVYGNVDGDARMYFTPFIRVEGGAVRKRDVRELERSLREMPDKITAQIIFRNLDEFKLLTDTITEVGCKKIDLNLGCPYPMQTNKGRGAAALENIGLLSEIEKEINASQDITRSAKVRLGMTDPKGWERVGRVMSDMPLSHITVHPRVATQGYKGELYQEEVEAMIEVIDHPIIYNGEIKTPEDIREVYQRIPGLSGVMIGRGLLTRPSLIAEYNTNEEWDHSRRLENILKMHDMMLEEYENTIEGGEHQIIQKMTAFWEYLEPEIGHKIFKAIKKSRKLEDYMKTLHNLV